MPPTADYGFQRLGGAFNDEVALYLAGMTQVRELDLGYTLAPNGF
jgi:hypothetical protein